MNLARARNVEVPGWVQGVVGGLHHVRWAPLIGGLIDSELEERELGMVLEHLESCRHCLIELECLVQMKASLARFPVTISGVV